MPKTPGTSIGDRLSSTRLLQSRLFGGATSEIIVDDLLSGSSLDCRPRELQGRSVLLFTKDQLAAAAALIGLDGIVNRIVICTPDVSREQFPTLIQRAGIDTIVSDHGRDFDCPPQLRWVNCGTTVVPTTVYEGVHNTLTEWVLLSSGTTGAPKMTVHSLASLVAPIRPIQSAVTDVVWGTFYDIRRYGGLQIFLRSLLGRTSLVLSCEGEVTRDYLLRFAEHRVTHASGTPSHWRRVLMSPESRRITPSYIRLSGEIVDQGILNAVGYLYPDAAIGHAFASTEAGVAFEVDDGLSGFPVDILSSYSDVEMKICNDSLWIRSNRTATRYLGTDNGSLADPEGFVDTGDIVELREGRYYFLGRRAGVINVGGLKVYPEEVETVINQHPSVRMSSVRAKRNSIAGSVVCADIVLKTPTPTVGWTAVVKNEILNICQQSLANHKIPVIVRFVESLDVGAGGKLVRYDA